MVAMPEVAQVQKAQSAAQVIAAAKAARERATDSIPVESWGVSLTVAPASPAEYYAAHEMARKLADQRGLQGPSVASDLAWFTACVKDPQFSNAEAIDLLNADPAEFGKIAQICRMRSDGVPWALFCLHIWVDQVNHLQEAEQHGEVPAGTHRFWQTLAMAFAQYTSDITAKQVDYVALGRALVEANGASVEQAADVLEQFLADEDVERKNASEGSGEGGMPASDGPAELPDS